MQAVGSAMHVFGVKSKFISWDLRRSALDRFGNLTLALERGVPTFRILPGVPRNVANIVERIDLNRGEVRRVFSETFFPCTLVDHQTIHAMTAT